MYLNELRQYQNKKKIEIRRRALCQNLMQPMNNEKLYKPSHLEEQGLCSRIVHGIKDFFYTFMATSSIHGFNHMTMEKRHRTEYVVWFSIVLIAGFGAVRLSLSTWERYLVKPTVVSLERNYLEWNTSLPGVTMCFDGRIDKNKMASLFKHDLKYIQNKKAASKFLEQLTNATFYNFHELIEFNEISPKDYLSSIFNIRYDVSYNVSNSNNELYGVKSLTLTMTEMGLCYAYNTVVASHNDPRYWFADKWKRYKIKEVFNGNPLDGDIYAQLMNINSGSVMYYHSPSEVADISGRSLLSTNSSYTTMDMSALSIYSTKEVRSLSVAQRQCRFLEESNLEISPIYTYNLCRMQCRVKLCQALCGCVPFFYRPTVKHKICDVKGMICLQKFSTRESQCLTNFVSVRHNHCVLFTNVPACEKGVDYGFPLPIVDKLSSNPSKCLPTSHILIKLSDDKRQRVDCRCLPPCNDVNYVLDTENTMGSWILGTSIKWGLGKYPRMRLKRDIIFGFSDLLVATGSTVGLFFGCSVLSLVEILYFFTLRLFWFTIQRQ